MNFITFDVSLQLVRSLRTPIAQLVAQDSALADQVRRAASSVPLNVAEGRCRAGKDRAHHYRVAAGSADEVRAALLVAEAWGYVPREAMAESLALLDRVLSLLWRLTH